MRAIELPDDFASGFDPHGVLESGDILVVPERLFPQPEGDREFLRQVRLGSGQYHKNIAYRPHSDRISGFGKMEPASAERLRAALRGYSQRAIAFLGQLLPRYRPHWQIDYASLRPEEESGRVLPLKKRNDLLHTDAFPTRPTNGGLILRFFTNIHPEKLRVWITSDPMATAAPQHARAAGLDRIARGNWAASLRRALRLHARSPYDEFMLGFHDYLKQNADYQRACPKYRFEFRPGMSWAVFTDIVPHAVESGQLALEQTLIISPDSLASPDRAPIRILEKLAGMPLAS